MDGILEQILSELKEIKQLLLKNKGLDSGINNSDSYRETMQFKEASEYLGITKSRIRTLAINGEIKHFKVGNRYLFKRKALDEWLEEVQEASIVKETGKIRRIKE